MENKGLLYNEITTTLKDIQDCLKNDTETPNTEKLLDSIENILQAVEADKPEYLKITEGDFLNIMAYVIDKDIDGMNVLPFLKNIFVRREKILSLMETIKIRSSLEEIVCYPDKLYKTLMFLSSRLNIAFSMSDHGYDKSLQRTVSEKEAKYIENHYIDYIHLFNAFSGLV